MTKGDTPAGRARRRKANEAGMERLWNAWQGGASWKEVARLRGRGGPGAAQMAVRRWAKKRRLPLRRGRDLDALERLWKARQDGASWAEVARLRGHGSPHAVQLAVRRWAKKRRLPLRSGRVYDRPARAWELRRAGWTWKRIAEELGYSSAHSACKAGRAASGGRTAEVVSEERTRRSDALERLWKARQGGASWKEVARLRGHGSPTAAQMAVRRWAKRRGLPLRDGQASDRPVRAWELRRAGWTWKRIAEELGYANAQAAYKAARTASGKRGAEMAAEERIRRSEEMERLWNAWQGGASWKEVVRLRGRGGPNEAQMAVRRWAKRHGLPLRNGRVFDRAAQAWSLHQSGWTWEEVAEALGYSTAQAAGKAGRDAARRREEEAATARRALASAAMRP